MQQIFPAAGALAPVAGELVARGYGRTEEYAADRHGVDILRRAGYSKDTMLNSLSWIRRVSGNSGGGFLATHPALDDRIASTVLLPIWNSGDRGLTEFSTHWASNPPSGCR